MAKTLTLNNPRPDFENGAVGNTNDARLALYDQIADESETERAADFEDVTDDMYANPTGTGGEDDEIEPSDGSSIDDADLDEHADPPAVDTGAVPRIKVNGVEVELTPELIAHAQKVASGDAYLAEASRIYREAQAPEPSVPDAPAIDEYALARAIQMGTEEEAVEAIRSLRAATTLPTGEIEAAVNQALAKRDTRSDMDRFKADYADLLKDDEMRDEVFAFDAMYADRQEAPTYDRFKKAADKVRKLHGLDNSAMEEKTQRKATAPRPVVGGNIRPAPQQEEREPTPREIIDAIAKSRHQTVMRAGN